MGIAVNSGELCWKPTMPKVRRVDQQGRIALPRDWRSKSLKGAKEVIVVEQDDSLLIRPRRRADITKYFESIEVDVDPKGFADYSLLKRELLKQGKGSRAIEVR
jgi:bifunctional DNA-binding transcriptional regulator/antitoxin component of YhaV-PrlF toxin-antitoxin module